MNISTRRFMSATALAAGLIFTLSLAPAYAADVAKGAANTTAGGDKIPTTEQARAAKMMPDDPNPALGQDLKMATTKGEGDKPAVASTGQGDPTTATAGQAAVGGPMSPGASAGGQNSSSAGGASETTGGRAASDAKSVRQGPIGATGQTMPSLFSERNEILDRVPIMAMPLSLSAQQRQRIYETVMADKSRQPSSSAEALAPASILSTDQALNDVQSLPKNLQDIDGLNGLQFIRTKDKVLLVLPATRIVVDAITL